MWSLLKGGDFTENAVMENGVEVVRGGGKRSPSEMVGFHWWGYGGMERKAGALDTFVDGVDWGGLIGLEDAGDRRTI